MGKDDVLAAFGGPRRGIDFADLIDADPAPRELTPIMRRYLRRKPRTGFAIVAWFFNVGALPLAALVPRAETIGWAVAWSAICVWLHLRVLARRRVLRKIVIDGAQVPAMVAEAHVTQFRHGMIPVGARVRVTLDVEGRRVDHVSFDGSLNELGRGAWIRVLVHPDTPDVVVPVISVS